MAYLGTPLLYCGICLALTALMLYPFRSIISLSGMLVTNGQAQDELVELDIEDLSDVSGGILKGSEVAFPEYNQNIGTLSVANEDGTYLTCDLYFGDNDKALKKGAGIYSGSIAPGYGSTVLIAGHNHTYFKPMKQAAVGDIVTITTYYGVYTYRLREISILPAHDKNNFDLLAEHENLVMYTCHPFGSIGMTPTRYFYYGEYLSGPMINIKE